MPIRECLSSRDDHGVRRSMIKIRVRGSRGLMDLKIYMNGNFEFPTEYDLRQFRLVVDPDKNDVHTVWMAWDILRKEGWTYGGIDEYGFLIWEFPQTDIEKLELALKSHDWLYEMSDDHRVWTQGLAEEEEIRRLMKIVGNPVAQKLYDKYVRSE